MKRLPARARLTLDEVIRPIVDCTCLKCGGASTIYPYPEQGTAFCPNCSPAWLKSFLEFSTATRRVSLGLSAA